MAKSIERSAEAALLGFHYQLDKTLIEIFSQTTDTSRIIIEGVEDVDIATLDEYRSIQCKYLEAGTPTPSSVRDPIGLMLKEFKKLPDRPWAFRLYAYFGSSSEKPLDFTPAGLKQIFTYKSGKAPDQTIHRLHEEFGVTDAELATFSACFRFEPGLSFDAQRAELLKSLQLTFSVGEGEASEFIYGKALSLILDLATRGSLAERTITKADFRARINDASSIVTSPWLVRLIGRKKALAFLAKEIKKLKLFTSTKRKTLVIDLASTESGGAVVSLGGFIKELVDHSYSPKKSLYDAVPWTVLINAPLVAIVQLKAHLLDNDIDFNDGYEHIRFTPNIFNQQPVAIRQSDKNGKATDRLGLVSFRCRIATLQTTGEHLANLQLGNVLLAIGSPHWQQKFRFTSDISMNIGNEWSRAELLSLLKG